MANSPHGSIRAVCCRRVVEVEQVGESKVLMFHTSFTTEVRVVEDDSDPQRLRTEFELVRSASATLIITFVESLTLHALDACNGGCHNSELPGLLCRTF